MHQCAIVFFYTTTIKSQDIFFYIWILSLSTTSTQQSTKRNNNQPNVFNNNAHVSPSPERLQRSRHLSRNTHPPSLVGVRPANVVERSGPRRGTKRGLYRQRVVPVLRLLGRQCAWHGIRHLQAGGTNRHSSAKPRRRGMVVRPRTRAQIVPCLASVPPRSLRPRPKTRHGHRLGVPPTPSVPPGPWGVHLSISARGTARPRLVEGYKL